MTLLLERWAALNETLFEQVNIASRNDRGGEVRFNPESQRDFVEDMGKKLLGFLPRSDYAVPESRGVGTEGSRRDDEAQRSLE